MATFRVRFALRGRTRWPVTTILEAPSAAAALARVCLDNPDLLRIFNVTRRCAAMVTWDTNKRLGEPVRHRCRAYSQNEKCPKHTPNPKEVQ